ncbi:putative secreted protein [Candidatus Nanobsidianus stetteri]|uniref:Putative secreted protein n=1 Tax=Nanobsidianus stetteri TaxID=1294122 RepID=R1G8Y7_NANST|nr:putative secreted protein [Candidatus Nanobsidianus stetteri]
MGIKRILYFAIVSFLLLISTFSIYSQVGADVVGSNSAQANSITLTTANLYYCVAASAGSTLTPSFNVMVNNGGFAVIGNSSTNTCSFTTTSNNRAIGGVSINNYSVPVILTTFTNTFNKPTAVTVSYTVSGQNDTVLILISSGGTKNGGNIGGITLPSGCSQLFLTSSPQISVYAAECKDLAPGSYKVSFNVGPGPGSTEYVSALVLGFPVFTFNITGPSNIDVYTNYSNSTTIYVNQLTGNTPLPVTLSCSTSNSNLQCSLSNTTITPNASVTLTVTASSSITPGTYSVTISGTAQNGATNSTTIIVNVQQLYNNPQIYIISPSNNSISNYYQLNISFYTNYPNVNVTINGNTYSINVTPGNNIIQLNYENSSYNLPGLYNIIPNGGNITIQLSTSNPLGQTNSTGIYIYTLPQPIFNVSYVYPTPSNGTQENIWLLEINSNVYDNTLGQDYCNIQLLNQTSNQWVTIANSCSDILYNGILQQYAKLNSNGYYSIWYRVYAYNNYGLNQYTNPQVIYISQNSYNVSVINNTLSNTQIQGIIDSAINSSIPIIVFSPGVYLVNLIINPQGKNITLLGQNTIFEPANPGLPVIQILSSNVTIQNININTNLFAINVNNGELNLINSNINSGLFGIDVKNPSIVNVYNSTINGNIGSIYGYIQNSTIDNVNIQSSVWGIYDDNPYNVIINNSNINGQIFGIYFDGNAINNVIENNNIISNIFGIKINNGNNNNIINNNIQSNIFGIYLTSSGNNIENDYIKVGQVFGLYETTYNNIINVTTNGGLFGYYLTGNATNISLYNSQLGMEIYGSGYINNLTTSTGSVNIYYNNSQGFVNSLSSVIYNANVNNVLYNYYEGISIIGNINGNITFIDLPPATSYIVEKIVAGNGNIISTNNTFIPQGFGNYELFYS